jgi:AraC-like DNA-binding protein
MNSAGARYTAVVSVRNRPARRSRTGSAAVTCTSLTRPARGVLDKPATSCVPRLADTWDMAVPLRPVAARPGPVPVISTYREHQAAPAVARAVVCTWQGLPGWHRRMRLLPDGCLDLVWDGRHARFARPADRQVRRPVGDTALVIGIRIRPGWAAVVTGTPVRHLPETADLADVWDSTAARQVAAALAAGDSAAACRAVLTDAVATRLASSGGPDPRVLAAVSVLGNPHANVGTAARYAGLSSRQLRRLFDEHIGLPPKILHSILRFQRLRAWLAASGPSPGTLVRAAADCGYFDQAHLCRDCARLGGLTPANFLAASSSPARIDSTVPVASSARTGSKRGVPEANADLG